MKQSEILKAIKYITTAKSFNIKDVDLILKSPYKEHKEKLINLVDFTSDYHFEVLTLHFLQNNTVAITADKLAKDIRTIELVKTQIRKNCYHVWQHNLEARQLITYIKVHEADYIFDNNIK